MTRLNWGRPVSLGNHPHLAIPSDVRPGISAIMAGWWQSWHRRPSSDGTAWRQHAEGTSWGHESWYHDSREGWNSEEWAEPSRGRQDLEWWGEEDDVPPAEAPLGLEAEVHEPDQYPWARQQTQDQHCASEGPEYEASTPPGATHDPPTKEGESEPYDDGAQLAASPPTPQEEREVLERAHAEAIRRFRLEQPSPDSDHDAKEGKASDEASDADEEPIDPEIGTYDPATGGVQCLICDRPQNSRGQFFDHVKGQKHKKKYDKYLKVKREKEAAAAQVALMTPLQ